MLFFNAEGQQWYLPSDEEDEEDDHNEYCEICFAADRPDVYVSCGHLGLSFVLLTLSRHGGWKGIVLFPQKCEGKSCGWVKGWQGGLEGWRGGLDAYIANFRKVRAKSHQTICLIWQMFEGGAFTVSPLVLIVYSVYMFGG